MNASLLSEKTFFRTAFLLIKSELEIEALGKCISEKLVQGIPFGGLTEYIRDEIPAIYINGVLGCRLILLGFPGEAGYNLELVEQDFPFHIFEKAEKKPIKVDLSGNLYEVLKDIEGISISLE